MADKQEKISMKYSTVTVNMAVSGTVQCTRVGQFDDVYGDAVYISLLSDCALQFALVSLGVLYHCGQINEHENRSIEILLFVLSF